MTRLGSAQVHKDGSTYANQSASYTTLTKEKEKTIREYSEQLYGNKFDNLEEMDNFLQSYSLQNWIKKKQTNWTDRSLEMKLKRS